MPGIDDKSKSTGKKKSKFVDSSPALTTDFQKIAVGFLGGDFVISNDSAKYIEYSWNGTKVDGKLLAGECIPESGVAQRDIWVRGEAGGEAYRIWISGE